MTAPLPPLPDVMCSQCGRDAIFHDACGPTHALRSTELVQAYATLAVREALERVLTHRLRNDVLDAKVIRAMIEELDK